jgi:serine carboxypeptidase-like clade 2
MRTQNNNSFPIIFALFLTIACAAYVKVNLPDYTGPALDVYSGFVTVDSVRGRALHYILIKAETNPDTSPLLVWYQGGPGCSGLIGLFTENGPFTVSQSGNGYKVSYSNLGWTRFANVLYLEQPAFVGFSYSNTSSDINTGDDKAAADNYQFLQTFLASEWPEYAGRDLWFTGESYGGVYVPTLTYKVLSTPGSLFNQFKGFMIGNPVFSCQGGFIGTTGPYDVETFHLLYWHGFISYSNYANWTSHGCNDPKVASQPACQYILNFAINQVGQIVQQKRDTSQSDNWPSLDPDDIFQNFCTGNGSLEFSNYPDPQTGTCSPSGTALVDYLNRADVQSALGIPKRTEWLECTNKINYNINGNSMNPNYEFFFKAKPGVKILVYSGDVDILTVPFAFTQPCIAQLSGKLVSDWGPWFVNGATAGYVEVYDKYTYATLKGAGHEAPQYQPLNSFELIRRFLKSGSITEEGKPSTPYPGRGYTKQGDILRRLGLSPNYKF